jgi:hypothetical protein
MNIKRGIIHMKQKFIGIFVIAIFGLSLGKVQAEDIRFSGITWDITGEGYKIEKEGDSDVLYLQNNILWLDDADLGDGVFKYSMWLGAARGFSGAMFRAKDRQNYEYFYIRHHLSGDADALQYTPTFNGLTGWQLYAGEGFWGDPVFDRGRWIDFEIVMSGKRAVVFMDGAPVLKIRDLKLDNASGGIGIRSSVSSARVRDVSYEPGSHDLASYFDGDKALADGNLSPSELSNAANVRSSLPEGLIKEWLVSNSFHADELIGKATLHPEYADGMTWNSLQVEEQGAINIARLSPRTRDANTVYVKTTIDADSASVRSLTFGYSDRVRLFVNGELVYSGNNSWRSRDVRYLGTIGLFDVVPLSLKPGKNEIVMAVTEGFGGWGAMAAVQDLQ